MVRVSRMTLQIVKFEFENKDELKAMTKLRDLRDPRDLRDQHYFDK